MRRTTIDNLRGIDFDGDKAKSALVILRNPVEAIVKKANKALETEMCYCGSHTGVPCEGLYIEDNGLVSCGHNGCGGVRCGMSKEDAAIIDAYESNETPWIEEVIDNETLNQKKVLVGCSEECSFRDLFSCTTCEHQAELIMADIEGEV